MQHAYQEKFVEDISNEMNFMKNTFQEILHTTTYNANRSNTNVNTTYMNNNNTLYWRQQLKWTTTQKITD